MGRGNPLFIGFPWAQRFGDRRSLFLRSATYSLNEGTCFWQTVFVLARSGVVNAAAMRTQAFLRVMRCMAAGSGGESFVA